MHFRPIKHLENGKMHTQERQLTRFFCILQLIEKENRTNGSFQNRTETELNQWFFLKTEPNLHIPTMQL